MLDTLFAKIGAVLAVPGLLLGGLFIDEEKEFLKAQIAELRYTIQELQVFGVALPSGPAIFETSLQSRISSTDTSLTLVANSVRGGSTLSGYNCFTLDEGRTDMEYVCGTVSGTAVTSLERGIDPLTGTTTNAALQFVHRTGANIKITDFPLIQRLRNQANGVESYPNSLTVTGGLTLGTVATYSAAPTFTPGSNQLITALYADSIAAQGAATSSESAAGIAQLATALQAASSTDLGANIPLVLQAKYATDTPTYGCAAGYTGTAGAGCSIVASLTGKLKQAWLDLTASFTWSGNHLWTGAASSTLFAALDTVYIGRTATSTMQGSTSGTSTLQGFLTVSGTNSTSTFSGNLDVTNNASTSYLTISNDCTNCVRNSVGSQNTASAVGDDTDTVTLGWRPRVIHYKITASDSNESAVAWGTWTEGTTQGFQTEGSTRPDFSSSPMTNSFTDGQMEITFTASDTGFTITYDKANETYTSAATVYYSAQR